MSHPSEPISKPNLKELFSNDNTTDNNPNLTNEEQIVPPIDNLRVQMEVDNLDLDQNEDNMIKENETMRPPQRSGYLNDFRNLQDRDSTYVFLFGKQQAGKTVLISSLIHHMGVDDDGALETRRRLDNLQGAVYLKSLHKSVREGYFMERTSVGALYELDLSYTPMKPKLPMKLTFLEMSGEDLCKVELSPQSVGKLPDNIDVFMNCPDIDLLFLLVVSYDEVVQQDAMMIDFLDYLKEKKPDYDLSNILLVITKWDRYEGVYQDNVEAFIKDKMPLVYSRIKAEYGSIAKFSIGQVSETNDHIIRLNDERPDALKRWLYKKITGRKIKSNISIFHQLSELF